jgi:hypothetical protein
MSGLSRWATPTWMFFHTFAAKINKDFFENNRPQCLAIIKNICICLPCAECTRHAARYMRSVNENTVRTKEQLIQMLFAFHNTVNVRTNKKSFEKSVLLNYDKARIDMVFVYFINGYSAKYGSIMSGRISNLGRRRGITRSVQDWMRTHWSQFQ